MRAPGAGRHPSADDLAAYSIGGLDPREERSVQKHVGGCERCATELRERFAPAVAVLAESVEQHEPPPELRQSLMATVHAEAGGAEQQTAAEPGRSRLSGFLLRPVTGVAVVALAIAGVAGYLTAEGGGDDAETVPITQAAGDAGGSLVLDDGSATLHMHGMEQLPKGAVYQVWVADPSGVQPSATFVPHEDGTATAAVPEAAGEATEVMVTREPRPGRTSPTLPPLVDLRLE